MEDVVMQPTVLTLQVVSRVPVMKDTLEMDSIVLVSLIKYVFNHYIFCLIYILHIWHIFAYVLSRLL